MRGGDLQRELRAGGVRLGGCRELRGRSGGDLRICVPGGYLRLDGGAGVLHDGAGGAL